MQKGNKVSVLTKVQCPLCEGENNAFITNEIRFENKADVYRCQDCGLTYLDQNSFEYPKNFYSDQYHQTYLTHVEPDALNPEKYFEKMKKSTQKWADKFCDMLKGDETVLDFGCSTGHFMDLVKHKTGKIYGHDLSTKEVEFSRSIGLDVSDQPLEERFDEGTFDYITMIYVLEHIAEPKSFLQFIKKFLKPDGKLVILVPNVQDALVNFYNIPEFMKFYYCMEHLFYYDHKTLKQLFDQVDMTTNIETIQEYPITNHLNWAYTRKPSDVIASRRGAPNVELVGDTPEQAWNELWSRFNEMYHEFLKSNGYGDRVWCVAGLK